ncbi:hypothetical protein ABT009_23715 [Streptomyces sp. NPDC002896]|uniref:hypothetical protein n=1 Tax=Streptomyces sp. NPDC002896 TaxID=3154438 RepID=UPI003323A9D9
MTHNIHTHTKPRRRTSHIAMIVAATAMISGGVILPASAATPALSHSTAAPTAVTDDGGGEGGEGEFGPGGDAGSCGSGCGQDGGGYTDDSIHDGVDDDSLYGPDHVDPGDATNDSVHDGYGGDAFGPEEVYPEPE